MRQPPRVCWASVCGSSWGTNETATTCASLGAAAGSRPGWLEPAHRRGDTVDWVLAGELESCSDACSARQMACDDSLRVGRWREIAADEQATSSQSDTNPH